MVGLTMNLISGTHIYVVGPTIQSPISYAVASLTLSDLFHFQSSPPLQDQEFETWESGIIA